MEESKKKRLFVASCISLLTTSMVFAIRGDIEGDMAGAFSLSKEQMGLIWGPAFYGFTAGILICAVIVDFVGMKLLHILSALGYIGGVVMVLIAPAPEVESVSSIFSTTGTSMLYFGFLAMGISQGIVEGVINPLAATIYTEKRTKVMNVLHAWWPGGIVIGGLLAFFLSQAGAPWQLKLSLVMVPAAIYLFMIIREEYPKTERVQSNVSAADMFKEGLNPFFLLLFGIMWVTAASELAPDQWFATIMKEIAKIDGILFLVYTAGLMFVLRFFFGGLVHRFNPFMVMAVCSVFCALGLFGLGSMGAEGSVLMAFVFATLFGVGKTFYWPTMLGVTAERFPRGGAFLLNLMGGAGMLSIAFALPVIGKMMDEGGAALALRQFAMLPGALVIIFALIGIFFKMKGGYKPVEIEESANA